MFTVLRTTIALAVSPPASPKPASPPPTSPPCDEDSCREEGNILQFSIVGSFCFVFLCCLAIARTVQEEQEKKKKEDERKAESERSNAKSSEDGTSLVEITPKV